MSDYYDLFPTIITIFLCIELLFIGIAGFDLATQHTTYSNQNGTCYDKNGNVINNVTCIENISCGFLDLIVEPTYCHTGK